MSYQIIKGQTGLVNPASTILDTGWTVNNNTASHGSCNSGTMVCLNDFGLVIGRAYVFTYSVTALTSGGVNMFAGTTSGTRYTANGTYSQQLVLEGNIFLSFFSDGNLTISLLSFYDVVTGPQPGRTISFHEITKQGEGDKWVSEKSHQPEIYTRFLNKLFTFSNGTLWLENSNAIMNNFFGVQYSSKIGFIFNFDYKLKKLWYNLRMDSTGKWYVSQMSTPADDQFPNGMQSVLTSTNIKSIDGVLWADILRDMADPNFYQILDAQLRGAVALFQGRMMQGALLFMTLQNDDTSLATINSIEAFYTEVQKSL